MGNCLASNKNTVSQTVDKKHFTEKRFPVGSSKVYPSSRLEGGRRKMVAFRLRGDDIEGNDEEEINSTGQGVRIRIVVTKEELKQILRNREDLKYASVEQLAGVLRWRDRRRIHEVRASGNEIANGNWKPALESIPEEEH